jgi:hypothetical protein
LVAAFLACLEDLAMTLKAVLTGDLTHSQTVSDTQAYLEGLQRVLAGLGERYGLAIDTYRGDGFQVVPRDPCQAFECALAIRAGLIAASPKGERWDARIAIGVGAATAGRNYGEAFVLSGQGLDSMKKLTLAVFGQDPSFMRCMELLTEFVAAVLDKWTLIEAQAYFAHIQGVGDQKSIAENLGKSRVAINQALQRAQARLLDRYLVSAQQWLMELGNA